MGAQTNGPNHFSRAEKVPCKTTGCQCCRYHLLIFALVALAPKSDMKMSVTSLGLSLVTPCLQHYAPAPPLCL